MTIYLLLRIFSCCVEFISYLSRNEECICYCSGFALSANVIFGTNPVSFATVYSTVIRRPSGSHTEYFPVTCACRILTKLEEIMIN